MENKNIILFIIVIIVVYLLYKMNKEIKDLKESFTNNATGTESIIESIKNLGIIAKEIQKDGNYKFPGNIVIPNGSKIKFLGPDNSGKYTEMYFHNVMNGLEIAQRGGADNLRLYQHDRGFDFGNGTIKTVGSGSIRINGNIHATGDIYADKSIAGKTGLRLNSTTIGPEHLQVLTGEKDFYIKNTFSEPKYLKFYDYLSDPNTDGVQWDRTKLETSKTRIEL